MKILIVAPPSNLVDNVVRAFRELGHTPCVINERQNHYLPGFLRDSKLAWRLRNISPFVRRLAAGALHSRILDEARRERPELFLTVKGGSIASGTVEALKQLNVRTVCWFPDDFQLWDLMLRRAPAYDRFFTFDSEAARRLRAHGILGARYLPFAADCVLGVQDDAYACDIAFIGAWYPEREAVLRSLSSRYQVHLYGWKNWTSSSLRSLWKGPADAAMMRKIFASARINLNIHFASQAHGANVRTFEIPSAGGFQLSSYRADIPELFVPDREIALYRDPSELPALIDRYLSDDRSRRSIAEAGRRRVLADHTYPQRMRQLLEDTFTA